MDLIPTLSIMNILAGLPLVIILMPFLKTLVLSVMNNPVVAAVYNTSLIVLESTELVWRPALQLSLILVKAMINALAVIIPQVKAAIRTAYNVTMPILRKIQAMGISMSHTISVIIDRMVELGDALIVLARGLSKAAFYALKGISAIVSSFETLATIGKKMVFAPQQITMQELSAALLPFLIVCSVITFVAWWRMTPAQKTVTTFQPRRSSRLARKRAMLYTMDLSDALPSCKKASAIPAYL